MNYKFRKNSIELKIRCPYCSQIINTGYSLRLNEEFHPERYQK